MDIGKIIVVVLFTLFGVAFISFGVATLFGIDSIELFYSILSIVFGLELVISAYKYPVNDK